MGWPTGLWFGGLCRPRCPSWWDKLGFYLWFFFLLASCHRDPASSPNAHAVDLPGGLLQCLCGAQHDLVTVTFAAVLPFLVFCCIYCIVSYCVLFF